MEHQNNNSKIVEQLLDKINNREFDGAWLKIKIDKNGKIANILSENPIFLKAML